jgi:hypothetical protein
MTLSATQVSAQSFKIGTIEVAQTLDAGHAEGG